MRFTRGGIHLATGSGPLLIEALYNGEWAYHQTTLTDKTYYVVTHIPTGLGIVAYLHYKREARSLCEHMSKNNNRLPKCEHVFGDASKNTEFMAEVLKIRNEWKNK